MTMVRSASRREAPARIARYGPPPPGEPSGPQTAPGVRRQRRLQKRRTREQLLVVVFLALALAATLALLAHQWLAPPASPAPASAGAAVTLHHPEVMH
jgi:hypothetical protein